MEWKEINISSVCVNKEFFNDHVLQLKIFTIYVSVLLVVSLV